VAGVNTDAESGVGKRSFGVSGRTWGAPYVFWLVGATDPAVNAKAEEDKTVDQIPSNHSPNLASEIHRTL
jgi:hypothetical protein